MPLESKLNHIGQNFSLKLLKDKTSLHSSISVNQPHQLHHNQLPPSLKLQNNKPKREEMIRKQRRKFHHHQKNNKKMEVWEDYLIEIFKLYIATIFVFLIIKGLSIFEKSQRNRLNYSFLITINLYNANFILINLIKDSILLN